MSTAELDSLITSSRQRSSLDPMSDSNAESYSNSEYSSIFHRKEDIKSGSESFFEQCAEIVDDEEWAQLFRELGRSGRSRGKKLQYYPSKNILEIHHWRLKKKFYLDLPETPEEATAKIKQFVTANAKFESKKDKKRSRDAYDLAQTRIDDNMTKLAMFKKQSTSFSLLYDFVQRHCGQAEVLTNQVRVLQALMGAGMITKDDVTIYNQEITTIKNVSYTDGRLAYTPRAVVARVAKKKIVTKEVPKKRSERTKAVSSEKRMVETDISANNATRNRDTSDSIEIVSEERGIANEVVPEARNTTRKRSVKSGSDNHKTPDAEVAQRNRAKNVEQRRTRSSVEGSCTHNAKKVFPEWRAAEMSVELQCVKRGSRLRVHITSEGYNTEANCQFPRDIRIEGMRYIAPAEDITFASGPNGKFFYRVKKGRIQKLDTLNTVAPLQIFTDDDSTCTICMDAEKAIVFAPCGHYCCCSECSAQMGQNCPICRRKITHRIPREDIQTE